MADFFLRTKRTEGMASLYTRVKKRNPEIKWEYVNTGINVCLQCAYNFETSGYKKSRKLFTYRTLIFGCPDGLGSYWLKPCFIKRTDIQ